MNLTNLSYGVVGLLVGAILAALLYKPGGTTLDPELLSGLPTIEMQQSRFEAPTIEAKPNETVVLALQNRDGMVHSFDIDELDLHVNVGGSQTGVAMFRAPSTPGVYAFYCRVPGHTSNGHTEGMIGKLIVS